MMKRNQVALIKILKAWKKTERALESLQQETMHVDRGSQKSLIISTETCVYTAKLVSTPNHFTNSEQACEDLLKRTYLNIPYAE